MLMHTKRFHPINATIDLVRRRPDFVKCFPQKLDLQSLNFIIEIKKGASASNLRAKRLGSTERTLVVTCRRLFKKMLPISVFDFKYKETLSKY